MKKLFILDVAHGADVPGKRSPDGKFREYLWSREMCQRILHLSTETNLEIVCPFLKTENEPGLSYRVKTYLSLKTDKPKCMLSLHNNAAGMGQSWMNARGFSVYTSKGQTKSDLYAEMIVNKLIKTFPELKTRIETLQDKDKDYELNFTVLMGNFPSILLEVLFQDNKEDVLILTSELFKDRFAKMMIEVMIEIDKI